MAGKLINWVGRPLLASEAQTKEALRCHKRGISLREIAKGLSLSLQLSGPLLQRLKAPTQQATGTGFCASESSIVCGRLSIGVAKSCRCLTEAGHQVAQTRRCPYQENKGLGRSL